MRAPSILLLAAVTATCVLWATLLSASSAAAASNGNGVIAFVNGDVWTIDPATGVQRNLTEGDPGTTGHGGLLSWSPDGSRLLYSAFMAGSPFGHAVPMSMRADGSSKRVLVDDPTRNWWPECWLGRDLVALRESTLDGSAADFYAVRPDGSGLRALTSDGSQNFGFGFITNGLTAQVFLADPQELCSPAAGLLFFRRSLDTYSLASDGTQRMMPVRGSVSPSPDGSRLAWLADDGLLVTGVDGTNPTKIAQSPVFLWQYLGPVQWSPDGREIAFPSAVLQCCSDEQPAYYSTVHVVSASGGGERVLTSRPTERAIPLAWSPDGARILFRSDAGFDFYDQHLFVVNADGTCMTHLFATVQNEISQGVVWQPVPEKPVDGPMLCADVGIAGEESPGPAGLDGIRIVDAGPIGLGATPYTFTVTNGGNLPARDVRFVLSDVKQLELHLITTTHGSCDASSCLLGTITPGESAQVRLTLSSANSDFPSFVAAHVRVRVSSSGTNSDDTNDALFVSTQAYGCPIGTGYADFFPGTAADDSYCGLAGADLIFGRAGNDLLSGGPGADVMNGGPGHDDLEGGGEDDTIYAQDGQRDDVDCGDAKDIAIVDRQDSVGRCERVARPQIPCRRYAEIGGGGTLSGTPGNDSLCGLFGNDRILGLGGNDTIDGGAGADTLNGGDGRDRIYGGGGSDYVLARDGRRDTIDCGLGEDSAVVDRFDRVTKNCEHVLRGRR